MVTVGRQKKDQEFKVTVNYKTQKGPGEMAWRIKCLLCQHSPITPGLRWAETGTAQGFSGQAVSQTSRFRFKLETVSQRIEQRINNGETP